MANDSPDQKSPSIRDDEDNNGAHIEDNKLSDGNGVKRTGSTSKKDLEEEDGYGDINLDSRLNTLEKARAGEGVYLKPSLLSLILKSRYLFFCSLFTSLAGFIFGYDQGVISVTLVMDQFLNRFPRVDDSIGGTVDGASSGFWKGFMTAMIELGAFVGAANQGYLADWLSRRYSIVLAVGVFTIGSILQTASVGYGMLVVGRLIGGCGIGMLSMVGPLYISEVAAPEIRGALLVLEELSIVSGIVVAFWITYGTRFISSEWSFRLPFLLQMVPGFILAIGILFLPFSPRWLASKGRDKECLESLSRLRQLPDTDSRVRAEWMEIREEVRFQKEALKDRHPELFREVEEEEAGAGKRSFRTSVKIEIAGWSDLFRPACLFRTHVGVMLMFFQQFVGINALIYYSPTLFKTMGLDSDMQLIMSGVVNVTQLVGVATSVWTMDWIGRRPLLIGGAACMTVAHVIIAVLVGKFDSNWPGHRAEGWTAVAFLEFYMFSFGASWGPVPWAMPSEIFPSSLRAKGVAISTMSNWINNFIIGLITPPLVQNTGYGAYVFFAVFCLLSLVWSIFLVPETKGVSLEEMAGVFGGNLQRGGRSVVVAEEEIRKRVRQELVQEERRREREVGETTK